MTRPMIALIGNPNSGKTAIFNLLTGLNQKVSNYPGITVDRKIGAVTHNNIQFDLLDLPGTYSITPETIDEQIVSEQILTWIHNPELRPKAIISVIDASNLSRNLFLTSQIAELGIPLIIALNMMDKVHQKKRDINLQALKNLFNAVAVVPMSATKKDGIINLKDEISSALNSDEESVGIEIDIPSHIQNDISPITTLLCSYFNISNKISTSIALRLITRESPLTSYENLELLTDSQLSELKRTIVECRDLLNKNGHASNSIESILRYTWLDKKLEDELIISTMDVKTKSRSESADEIITHPVFGPLIFLGILYFVFQSIFTWASAPMDFIDSTFAQLGSWLVNVLPSGLLRDLLIEGVVAGVGAILIFLPQIIILILFLCLLEDSGYMARVAFMMDNFMRRVGLHGRSVLPLMSGYACAIPGIMAARTIDSWRERLITILVLPLLSCSARLPVYALLISAFIPDQTVLGIFNLQGLTMVTMYLLGTCTAFVIAKIFTKFIPQKGNSSFVMELPPYRIPMFRSVFNEVFQRAKAFLVDAGKIIMAISIVLWILASFPKLDNGESVSIHESYAGRIGHAIEPVIQPLGYDWKIGIGLLTSFAAREVMVSTLATIYNVEASGDDFVSIKDALKNDRKPDGSPTFTVLVALSLMVFYVYAAQCMATFAIVKNETNSWKWPLIMMVYMSFLAYFGALLVYQGGQFLGFT
ncbi:MAG: ferrous iron transport protein B [Candidatus Marinimicrobia bacterium]|nr:ferrous iron transport protein B [Candidatus Neomarinimicrobiota bacterium]